MATVPMDYGIDLGTTNSKVAVLEGVEPRVIANREGAVITPSVVWEDKRGRLHVGREAKERYYHDEANADMEFKLRMGKGAAGRKRFARSGREMLPEEMSAEILKSLRADVRSACGVEIQAAVITVPADFVLPQSDATRRAAELAGLLESPLVQEPVAAALAYGFQRHGEKAFWMVYDFGGGTFDAAVVQVRDGIIVVVNHEGDNHLGGKLIDWDIVEKLLVPAIVARGGLPEFRRGNDRWKSAFAKLKLAAERAKIEVCRREEPSQIWIEDLCEREGGGSFDFEYELTPREVEEITLPYVVRSLTLCGKALKAKGLRGQDMERVLMVGGTSMNPWLRRKVAEELEAPLEFSIDPVTAVARGAAIFAGSQTWERPEDRRVPSGAFRIELQYDPVGVDLDPPVGGRVRHPGGRSLKGYTVEFVEGRSQWRSGKTALGPEGAFLTSVHAEEGRRCEFAIELCDPEGRRVRTEPDRFPYTVGAGIGGAPLTHTIGVAMANNRVDPILRKGTVLQAEGRTVHRTAYAIKAGADDVLCVPLVEGEHLARADRNRLIGKLVLRGHQIERDIPAGSDVEIIVCVDASRLVKAKAYVPILEKELELEVNLETGSFSESDLREAYDRDRSRLEDLRRRTAAAGAPKAAEILTRIETERMAEQIEGLLAAGAADPDGLQACGNRLLDLRAALDELEDDLAWPTLVARAREEVRTSGGIVAAHGWPDEKERLTNLQRELERAEKTGDPDALRSRLEEISTLASQVLLRQDVFWVGFFGWLYEQRASMVDPEMAGRLFARGQSAIEKTDVEALKAVVRQLLALLPLPERDKAVAYGASTIR